jgi:putative salt-induced outer membrane protein
MRELTAEYGADSDSQTSNVDYNKPNCRELFSKEQHERRLRNTYNYIHNKLTLFISCIGFLLKTSLIFMEIKMKKFFLLTTSVLCVSAIPAQAQTGLLKGWSGEASLTGAVTTGNTETTDLGLGLKLAKESGGWRHKFDALGDLGRASGEVNRRRYDIGYQIDRDLSDRLYVYGNADYFSDDFGAFQEGYFIGAGAGYKAITAENITWNLEGGAGYRSQETQAPLPPVFLPGPVTANEVALRAFSDFDYKLNENVSLYNDTEIIWSESDTYIWNDIGLTATLAGNLAARASFRIDHHTDVPVGRENTDTITRFGLVYTMK